MTASLLSSSALAVLLAIGITQHIADAWSIHHDITRLTGHGTPTARQLATQLRSDVNFASFTTEDITTTSPSTPTAPLDVTTSAPKDGTFTRNPYKRFVKPLTEAGFPSKFKSKVHDLAIDANGGVWQSNFLNKRVYGTSSHRPDIIRQLTRAEAKGYLLNDWFESVKEVLGRQSLVSVEDVYADDSFFKAKKVLVDALSTQNLIGRSVPVIERELERVTSHWDKIASSGSTPKPTAVYARDVSSLTYAVIVNAIFGSDTISKEEMERIREYTAHITKGVVSFQITTPVLRKFPFLRRYQRAMDARDAMRELMKEKIGAKRALLEKSKTDPSVKFESTGILDDFILQLYATTSSTSDLSEEDVIQFCVDNTIVSIFAGFDTTASVSTNILLLLHDDAHARELVRNELESFDITSMPKGQLEVMDSLPAFKSVMLEAFRLRPAIPNTYRKTTVPIVVGNAAIPANSTVQLSYSYGGLSEKLYDTPERLCPLRFYQGGGSSKTSSSSENLSSSSSSVGLGKDVPRPNVFGYGKHLCPGQYLAQLEITMLTKAFLSKYDYELVEGQDTSPSVPMNSPKSGLELRLWHRV